MKNLVFFLVYCWWAGVGWGQRKQDIPAGFVYVQGGTFQMGDASSIYSDEKPVHSVTVSDFYLCDHEVTQAEWVAVMGSNPSSHKGDNLPVENVNYDDVKNYIAKLNANRTDGYKYRLPTEAEWEYAAKGGIHHENTTYSGSNTLADVGWYGYGDGKNSDSKTHPVKQLGKIALGLYDMSGNVWEWCSDWYDENYYKNSPEKDPENRKPGSDRVIRGGSWYSYAADCRSAYRYYDAPADRDSYLGFRVVLAARR